MTTQTVEKSAEAELLREAVARQVEEALEKAARDETAPDDGEKRVWYVQTPAPGVRYYSPRRPDISQRI